MTQEKTRPNRILHPEEIRITYSIYSYTTDDGVEGRFVIPYYGGTHIGSDRYPKLNTKGKKPTRFLLKSYNKFRALLGRGIAFKFNNDPDLIMSYVSMIVAQVYWETVLRRVIEEHDIVTCCKGLFVLDVFGKKIRNKKYVTIENEGVLHSIRLSVTEKGYKVAGQNFYHMKVSRRYLEQIQQQINNKKFYG
jgi:hypothetical protein